MAAPDMKKMRRIADCPAPMVRRMAMSRPLFFTSMTRPEMMFIAAITTTIIRIRRITLRSTCRALKKAWLRSRQSVTMAPGPAARMMSGLMASSLSGIGELHFHKVDRLIAPEEKLGLFERHVDEGLVVFGDARH